MNAPNKKRAGVVAACVFYAIIAAVATVTTFRSEGFTLHALLSVAWFFVLPLSMVLIALAGRFQKWFEERNVVVTSSERERLYRVAPLVIDTTPVFTVPRIRHVVATVPLVLAGGLYYVRYFSGGSLENVPGAAIFVGVVATLLVIGIVVRRVHASWRARRNARLAMKWQHWLESPE